MENIETCFYAYISFIPFALHQTTGDVEAVKEKTSLAEQMDDVVGFWIYCEQFSYIDKDATNMMGISRGGMMTYEVLSKDERVHKAVVVSGLSGALCHMRKEVICEDHIRFFVCVKRKTILWIFHTEKICGV